jgi:hypothetical protein
MPNTREHDLKTRIVVLMAAWALAGCDLRYALLGFPAPKVAVASPYPLELEYREAKGGLVILRGRVDGKADVDFILDTGAPVTVLLDGRRTAALGLDSSGARPLGDPTNPATPTGVIQGGFDITFGGVALSGLTAVVIPESTMPCRERFDEIDFGGVIGADLFKQFVVEIDTRARRVRLHDPKSWRSPAGAASIPITFRNGHPFVKTSLSLGEHVVEAGMNVDTGMNRALTLVVGSHPAIVMPAEGTPRKSCYVNGVRDERDGAPVTVDMGGVRIVVAAPVYSAAPNAVDGGRTSTLGISFFRDRKLVVDYPGSRMVLD